MGARLREFTGFGANDWLHVEQRFVDADFQNSGDHIFGLTCTIAPEVTNLKLAEAHIARCAGNDFVGEALAAAAGEVLVAIVGGSDEPALDEKRVLAAAPWTDMAVG